VAVIAPASPFPSRELDAGAAELRALGFDPVYDDSVYARRGYVAGTADVRAAAFMRAWESPDIAAIVAARGGYGSVQILPRLDVSAIAKHAKAFIGYSDNTSILNWLTLQCGIVSFHGPMIDRRLSRGVEGYDRDTFVRCLCRAEPVGDITHPQLEVLIGGEASGMLIGGTLTQLVGSFGTPYAFDPPPGSVLFIDEVGERPFRIDRMLMQLRLSGILGRAAALVFGELPGCDEPGGEPTARSMLADVLADFRGPVLVGLPSGHSVGPTMTLPFGVHARVLAGERPRLVIEEAAVTAGANGSES
jgi:muramoyltetrapeptide carboxypeptidase